MIKTDRWIAKMAIERNMISPFVGRQVRETDGRKVVSYGVSSYGYDARCGNSFKVFKLRNPEGVSDALMLEKLRETPMDPLDFNPEYCCDFEGDFCIVPPNGFVLCHTVEYFRIPSNVHAYVLGKSTYARVGAHCLTTPLEAGWEGEITIEIANVTPFPVKVYAGQGICQVCFHEAVETCLMSYRDRSGKYQGQRGVTFSKG